MQLALLYIYMYTCMNCMHIDITYTMLYNITIPSVTSQGSFIYPPKISKQKNLVTKLSETFQGGCGGGNTLSFDLTLRKRQHVSQRGRGVHQSLGWMMDVDDDHIAQGFDVFPERLKGGIRRKVFLFK